VFRLGRHNITSLIMVVDWRSNSDRLKVSIIRRKQTNEYSFAEAALTPCMEGLVFLFRIPGVPVSKMGVQTGCFTEVFCYFP
jgi:hypothetical protein